MPRSAVTSIENNFSKGLLTEYTGLNFPENSCTETFNCVFERTGRVTRRLGLDIDEQIVPNQVARATRAQSHFQWKNPNGDGTKTFLVQQIGNILYFYDASDPEKVADLAIQRQPTQIDLNGHIAPFAPILPSQFECEFASGYGFLFVFNPACEPFYVEYNSIAGQFVANSITVQIRDFAGLVDELAVNQQSPGLSGPHLYNLGNQGWTSTWQISSSSDNSFTGGPHQFVIPGDATSLPSQLYIGKYIRATYVGDFRHWLKGTVTGLSLNSIEINATSFNNPDGFTDVAGWLLSDEPDNIRTEWAQDFANFPSNADIWWRYKDENNIFDPGKTYKDVTQGTGPAPKGHFILDLFNQDRSAVSGINATTGFPGFGTPAVTTTARPTTGAFYAGRVWYTGINTSQFSNSIFFSQIIENRDTTQFGKCFQKNDPTSEDFFELLASDGGTIVIQNADTIYKLWPTQNALLVFAGNGIWAITGNQGIGFTATDYAIQRLDYIPAIGPSSFLDFRGLPVWWNLNGIYTLEVSPQGGFAVKSLTGTTIDTFYNSIPANSKKYAKGAYNKSTYIMQWVFRSEDFVEGVDDLQVRYEYDRILCYNTVTGAFYPWIPVTGLPVSRPIKLHGIVMLDTEGSPSSTESEGVDPFFKYVVSWQTSPTAFSEFVFAEERNENLKDWEYMESVFASGDGEDYLSYFITGYKLHGKAIAKFQAPVVKVFCETPTAAAYKMQGIWDYAVNSGTGRFTSTELITHLPFGYGIKARKHRLRGQGYSLQFKISSFENRPFDIIGWTTWEAVNTAP